MSYDFDEADAQEAAAQDRFERNYNRQYMAHPDCRDPDHPGCELCMEDDE